MKKIITLIALMLSLFATAQEVGDTMYVCRNDNVIERIAVSKIDSVTFVAPVLHAVSVSEEGGGACSITGINGTSAEIITDKVINVVAVPAENHLFLGWFIDDSETPVSTELSYTFTVSEDVALVARFKEIRYLVSLAPCDNGTVAIDGKDGYSADFVVGSAVTITATPNEGCEFVGWFTGNSETAVSTEPSYTFTVSEDIALVAKFYRAPAEIDLGLPSGVRWADFNVGATKPEEYGGYYAWGETGVKDDYKKATYKLLNGNAYSKYCSDDNKTTLELVDDVANVLWGGDWRMPTLSEVNELKDNCEWEWTSVNGVDGYKVTGPNGNSIFLPAAGYCIGTQLNNVGTLGYYWSSSAYSNYWDNVFDLEFNSSKVPTSGYDNKYRYYGLTVRPVNGYYTISVSGNGNGTVAIDGKTENSVKFIYGNSVTVVATADAGYVFSGWYVGEAVNPVSLDARYTFTVSNSDLAIVAKFRKEKQEIGVDESVDLGLPSGVKWANFNVGATRPEEYGGYYAWGETGVKAEYRKDTYKLLNGNAYSKYCSSDNKTNLELIDDVANVLWGGDWRMPTLSEVNELKDNCEWEWTSVNGVDGYKVTGPNGNSIFLPAAGYCIGTQLNNVGTLGYYWSSSAYSNYWDNVFDLEFNSSKVPTSGYDNKYRYYGLTVRPVNGYYTISVSGNGNGTVAIDGKTENSVKFIYGNSVTVVATADAGYVFSGWYVGEAVNPVSLDARYTFTVSNSDLAIVAKFRKEKQEIGVDESVDLGLPSGVKWANFNVGATRPEEYGGYYAWGETGIKAEYTKATYKLGDGNAYNPVWSKYCSSDNKTTLELVDDVANVLWGGDWRMPTLSEVNELKDNCEWEWTSVNGVDGYKVTGPNGNSIFLPAAGYYIGTQSMSVGTLGYYWSSSAYPNYWDSVFELEFNSSEAPTYKYHSLFREYGLTVRPVRKDI